MNSNKIERDLPKTLITFFELTSSGKAPLTGKSTLYVSLHKIKDSTAIIRKEQSTFS